MIDEYAIFFIVLLAIATLLHGDFAFVVLYLFAGAYILGQAWNRYALNRIRLKRTYQGRAFLGEKVPVVLRVSNTSLLPIVWLRIHESVPLQLVSTGALKEIISLNPRGHADIPYTLHARKRGLYSIGPLFASSNDLIGLTSQNDLEGHSDHLIVYPLIVPLVKVQLPSRSPLGTLRHNQPIFEDPTRVLSKRDYVNGDSLRRVDWKASASLGRLQVKKYEPSIALETVIFLNLNSSEYPSHHRVDSTELGIVIAASLANWIVSKKQAVGLITNGIDPSQEDTDIKPIPSRKGQGNLMRILDTLARVQISDRIPFETMISQHTPRLPWGTTLILIVGKVTDALFDEIFQAQRRGQSVVLILAGHGVNVREIRRRAESFDVKVYAFTSEEQLNSWGMKG